jgi:DNA-binding GntR family transcriptional regulator
MVNRKTKYREIADIIRNEICQEEIPAGSHIPVKGLMKRFNVGDAVIGDSMRILRSEGLVVRQQIEGRPGKPQNFAKPPEGSLGGSPERM